MAVLALLHRHDEVELLLVGRGGQRDVGEGVREVDGGGEYAVVHGDERRELVAVEVLEGRAGRFEDCAAMSPCEYEGGWDAPRRSEIPATTFPTSLSFPAVPSTWDEGAADERAWSNDVNTLCVPQP